MRKFSSYGPVHINLHYYAPREELIDRTHLRLVGENPDDGGHYITVWAPRQTGKTWTLQQVLFRLKQDERFDVLKINLEHLKMESDVIKIVKSIGDDIIENLNLEHASISELEDFQNIFKKSTLKKPLILILDEFDALAEDAISALVGVFRNIYNIRGDQWDKSTGEKKYFLHGVALIGVRSVLGIENVKGSPFNVQRSVHIPNLTYDEVDGMFRWYERESGQRVEREVVDRLYYETQGQPGLTCWFGELLTEGWDEIKPEKNRPVGMTFFKRAYMYATYALPNANILNIISKAKEECCRELVLELFKTVEKTVFKYDNHRINFLYMNGVIDREETESSLYVKFSCPFVQKRVFNYFSDEIFSQMDNLVEPFEDLEHAVSENALNVRNIMKLYRKYLIKNRDRMLKNAPRRSDLRIHEAVFHFNLYMYLHKFLKNKKCEVYPEFPTGNGKIDIIIKHNGRIYGIELKSFTDKAAYEKSLRQAARYGEQLNLKEISLVFFVEYVDDENRKKYEADYVDETTGVKVMPIFVETGD